jgi:hypothetical protein
MNEFLPGRARCRDGKPTRAGQETDAKGTGGKDHVRGV